MSGIWAWLRLAIILLHMASSGVRWQPGCSGAFCCCKLYIKFTIFFFFWPRHVACRILVSRSGSNPGPWQWEHGILTTGPPGNSVKLTILKCTTQWHKVPSHNVVQPSQNYLVLKLFYYPKRKRHQQSFPFPPSPAPHNQLSTFNLYGFASSWYFI